MILKALGLVLAIAGLKVTTGMLNPMSA